MPCGQEDRLFLGTGKGPTVMALLVDLGQDMAVVSQCGDRDHAKVLQEISKGSRLGVRCEEVGVKVSLIWERCHYLLWPGHVP